MSGIKIRHCAPTGCVVMAMLLTGLMLGCKSTTSGPIALLVDGDVDHGFPEFFLEKGSDLDSSYISFRGKRSVHDTLQLEMTSWGVVEYGLLISRQNSHLSASFILLGRCGTVTTRTWKKVTLTEYLSPAEQDTLWNLLFTNWRDTLAISKTRIADIAE